MRVHVCELTKLQRRFYGMRQGILTKFDRPTALQFCLPKNKGGLDVKLSA